MPAPADNWRRQRLSSGNAKRAGWRASRLWFRSRRSQMMYGVVPAGVGSPAVSGESVRDVPALGGPARLGVGATSMRCIAHASRLVDFELAGIAEVPAAAAAAQLA